MLRNILERELLDHLRSLRFSLSFMLVVILMVTVSALFIHDYHQSVADYSEDRNTNQRLLEEKAAKGLFAVVSGSPNQLIYRAPNPLGFVSEGREKNLPNAFEVDVFELTGPQMRFRGNDKLWRFESLDWAFLIGVILSFAALVFTYDTISGEREAGTLRLCLSNPLPCMTLLLGKLLGALISLMIPLMVGMLLSLLILSVSGVVPMESIHWGRIGLVALLSVLYLSIFVALGLFISSLTQTSTVSLTVLLLAWAVLVIIVPRMGGILASEVVQLPDVASVSQQAGEAVREVLVKYGYGGYSVHWSPGEPLGRSAEIANVTTAIHDDYRNRQIHQVQLAQRLTCISPAAIYQFACESLVGSGIQHYERFLEEAREYRRALLQFTFEKYPYAAESRPNSREAGSLHVSLEEIPRFTDTPPRLSSALVDASWSILLLFLVNGVFLMGAFGAFVRYDVR